MAEYRQKRGLTILYTGIDAELEKDITAFGETRGWRFMGPSIRRRDCERGIRFEKEEDREYARID